MDLACLVVITLWLSHAWYYPSYITADAAPGIEFINLAFQASCLYGTCRLVMTRASSILFAEPLFLLILLLGASSLVTTTSFSNTLGMVRSSFLFFCACLFLRYRYRDLFVVRIVVDILGTLLVMSVIASLLFPFGIMQGYDSGRWRGVFGHKNSLGEYSALTLILLLGMWRTGVMLKRRHAIYGLAALLCLIRAEAATAIGVVALGVAVLELSRLFTNSKLRRSAAMGIYLFFFVVALLAAQQLIGIVAESLGRDLTFTGRTAIWEKFMVFGMQRPWVGWGWATIGTSEYILPLVRMTLGLPNIQTPHNGYLSIIVELGFPTLLVYILWLAATFLQSTRRAVFQRDPIWALRAVLIVAVSLHNFFESTAGIIPSLWLLLVLTTGPRKQVRWK